MNDDKKYQIFISSTFTDLIEARDKVIKVVLDLYHFPVGMEMFSADDDEQWKVITDAIDVTDYYVLIIGHRYGSVANDGISYTEKEFDYAKSKGIPIVTFIRDRQALIANNDRDDDPVLKEKLNNFIAKAKTGRICSFWNTLSDLEREVAIALPKTMSRHQGIGWVRATQNSPDLLNEIVRLNEEKRLLHEELELLKKSKKVREPRLSVYVNEYSAQSVEPILFPLIPPPEELLYKHRDPISFSTIPRTLQPYISKEEINQYNLELSKITEDKILNYNHGVALINRLSNGQFNLNINICNEGTARANAPFIQLTFPDFINVYHQLGRGKFHAEYLSALSVMNDFIPNAFFDPIIEAKKRGGFPVDIDTDLSKRIETAYFFPIDQNNTYPQNILNGVEGYNFGSERISNHRVLAIQMQTQAHALCTMYSNFIVVPTHKGEGQINAYLMCDEYEQAQILSIPISVQ